ncbi:hypothetical protein TWF694_004513 [Orbilia ellipsospora]|uniref:Uncharacterized protein n=1 Tax=Orbilia ellipsospora TaxID=2528407 RepID=A0AAV9WXK6_9PEZI
MPNEGLPALQVEQPSLERITNLATEFQYPKNAFETYEAYTEPYVFSPPVNYSHQASEELVGGVSDSKFLGGLMPTDWITKTTRLNANLHYQYQISLSHDFFFESQLRNNSGVSYQIERRISTVDDILTLSQYLLDAYEEITPGSSSAGYRTQSKLSSRQNPVQDNIRYSESPLYVPPVHDGIHIPSDSGAQLLLLSCRVNMLNTYWSLLLYFEAWYLENTPGFADSSNGVPSFTFGKFSFQPSLYMRVIFVLQVMEHFLNRLQEVSSKRGTQVDEGCRLPSSTTPMNGLGEKMLGEVTSREIKVLQKVRELKKTISENNSEN